MNLARLVKCVAVAALVATSTAALPAADAKREYFQHVREVKLSQPAAQNFIVLDSEIWSHARPDLGDLRLYSNGQVVPYALRVQGNAEYSEQRPVKVLNKGITAGATQFLLDMSGVDVYDQVTLDLNQRDFDRLATVEGANSPDAATWTKLTTAPIFDFTKQRLGTNLTVTLPESNFRYLRIAISNTGADHGSDVLPQQIIGAKASNTYRTSAVWDNVAGTVLREEKPHETVFHIELPKAVPIDRFHFSIVDDRINFRRPASVEIRSDDKPYSSDDEGWQPIANGDVSRVHSAGGKIHEELDIATHDTRAAHWRVTLRNGDDPPLPVQLTAQTLERRLYFDPQAATSIKLYYGDEKVSAPIYDYDKFFHDADAKSAIAATLGSDTHNPDFSARPDDRPWTERNNWVLWIAMIVAVLGIGTVALRGLKKA